MDEQEEKEGTDWGELFGHAVRFMILVWSLAMMPLGYMDKIRNDGAFLAGLTSGRLSAVSGQFGLNIKKGGNGDNKKLKGKVNIVDNKDTNVGIK